MRLVSIRYTHGPRVGGLTIDPLGKVPAAFWTHRPARRPPAGRVVASQPLAAGWRGVMGLPFGVGALALGQRVELLPTGYGLGGAALLLTRRGQRTLVVGPTTEALVPRAADCLVLNAPAIPEAPGRWLEAALEAERVVVPDDAAAAAVVSALEGAGIPHRRPSWLGGGVRRARLGVFTRGEGLRVDLRPQASEAWLVDFAREVQPELVCVHGLRAGPLATGLVEAGLSCRILHAPEQLTIPGLVG